MEEKLSVQVQEPTLVVSTEPITQEATPEPKVEKVEELKLPTTKEEFEKAMKAAVNREKTNFLKELGVKSVKQYREQLSKAEEALSKHEELTKQNQDLITKQDELSKQFESIKQTSTLERLGVKEEYREDLVKLAAGKVDETHSFEDVLKELVETKYQYAVNKGPIKIGAEKTQTNMKDSTTSTELQKKYSWLK